MRVLVVNAGSSSIKYRLIDIGDDATADASSRTTETSVGGIVEEVTDHAAALRSVVDTLSGQAIDAVGHRVVHGGERFSAPTVVDDAMLGELRALTPLAPLHNPANIAGIEAARRVWPAVPHVAVFDTAFHASLAPHAFRYAVPDAWYREHGVRRYGFHGTSHAYVAAAAAQLLGRPLEELRLITAHLGNGASTAAIAEGRSVDTSMGLSPLEGLVMGTRSGDVDPTVVSHVAAASGREMAAVTGDLNRASGLVGLCGESDMRRIVERVRDGDEAAELALDVFCHRVRKYVGAHLVTLGRCDALVFTGGIGEHSPDVRARVCARLEPLGIRLDAARNDAGDRIVSDPESSTALLVVPTDEERAIAEQTASLLAG